MSDRVDPATTPEASPRSRRRWPYLLVGLGLLAIVALLGGLKFAQIATLIGMGEQMQKLGPPPEAVGSDVAAAREWETTLAAVGTVVGERSVAVSNDAPGIVKRIRFESGDTVKRGDILVELDVSAEHAQLESATARRDQARRTLTRSRRLVAASALAQADLDQDETSLQTATHEAEALRAQIARKIVRAPFDGRLGIRAVDVGQYLTPGTTVTVLDRGEGLFVDFALPQDRLPAVAVGMPVRITATAGSGRPAEGRITAIAPTVDPITRNLKLRASVASHDANLRPGMFVSIAVVLPARAPVVVVPATAIVHASYGDSIFVIEDKPTGSPGMAQTPDGKPVKIARQQFVRLGPSRGDYVAIAQGVEAGQQIVSAGGFKLRNGAPVVVDNTVKARAELDPRPENR